MAKNRFTHNISGEVVGETFILLSSGYHKCLPLPLKERNGVITIDHQIGVINKMSKNADIIVVLGYEPNSVMDHINLKHPRVRVVENTRFKETTSLESLRLGMNCSLLSNVYAIHGDILFSRKALKVCEHPSVPVRRNSPKKNANAGVLMNADGSVKNISYGLPDEWAEMLHIPHKFFNLSKSLLRSSRSNHLFEFINELTDHTPVMAHMINAQDSVNNKD